MKREAESRDVRIIPIDRILVRNPRERDPLVFAEIVQSIRAVGLKKPITVTANVGKDGIESFRLVCGEGRIKALQQLGETQIPALVVEATEEDAYIMSLVENLARRRYRPMELLMGVRLLHAKGFSGAEICRKTGLSREYVSDLLMLINHGEERLIAAVEKGVLSMHVAFEIVEAGEDNKSLQETLHQAYESGALRGKQLLEVRKVLKRRAQLGKALGKRGSDVRPHLTPQSLVRTYQQEVERQRQLVRKGDLVQERLLIVISALRRLFADENFMTLLRAEGLTTLPKCLAERMAVGNAGAKK